jgi:hypothetical protein
MNHRVISAMVSIVAAFLIIAGCLFALTVQVADRPAAASAENPQKPFLPAISHSIEEGMSNCVECHNPSDGSFSPSHRTYSVSTCMTCHKVKASAGK